MPRGKKAVEKVQAEEVEEQKVEVEEVEEVEEKPVKKTKAKASKADAEEEETDGSGRRSFRLLLESVNPPVHFKPKKRKDGKDGKEYDGGRFKGKGPMQAAKKTFTQIARASDMDQPEHTFTIVETTAGSNKGTFSYIGTQVDLDEPQKIEKSNVNFNVKFKRTVKSYKPDADAKPAKAAAKKTPAKKGGRVGAAKNAKPEKEVEEAEVEVEEEKMDEAEVEEKEPEEAEVEEKPAKKVAKAKKPAAKKGGKNKKK